KVETQAVGRDERTLLSYMRAEHFAHRLVEQVRGGMVRTQARAARMIDFHLDRQTRSDRALLDAAGVHEDAVAALLRVRNLDDETVAVHHAGIADLTAGLAVERRLVDNDADRFAFPRLVDDGAVAHKCGDDAF